VINRNISTLWTAYAILNSNGLCYPEYARRYEYLFLHRFDKPETLIRNNGILQIKSPNKAEYFQFSDLLFTQQSSLAELYE